MPRKRTDARCRDRAFIRCSLGVVALLLLATWAATANAQSFELLRKGIELVGGSYRDMVETSDGKRKERTSGSPPYSFKPVGSLIVGNSEGASCRINGVPTPTGVVFSKRGPHRAQIHCDPIRQLQSTGSEEEQMSVEFESKASAAGGVITFSVDSMSRRQYRATNGQFTSGFTQTLSRRWTIRVRISGRTCQVIEHRETADAVAVLTNTDGQVSTTKVARVFFNDPPETCRFVE